MRSEVTHCTRRVRAARWAVLAQLLFGLVLGAGTAAASAAPDQERASVTLNRVAPGGVTETLTGVTRLGGTVVFTLVNLASAAEYIATAAGAQSNAIALTPLTG